MSPRLSAALVILATLSLVGCERRDQRTANEKVRAANKALEEADDLRAQDRAMFTELSVVSPERMTAAGKQCMTRREGALVRFDTAAALLHEAADLKVSPVYRNYLLLRAEAASKRARATSLTLAQCRAMVDGDEPESWSDMDRDKSFELLSRYVAILERRARKILEDHPDVFME
ncbi:MAG: hypothetical protein U0271_04675 [Polyangiaceae bacterium]